jgi:hypothetical protein
MKFWRELLSYAVYAILVAALAMAFAICWHDYMTAFHLSRHGVNGSK